MKRICRKCGNEYEASMTPEEQLLSAIFGRDLCEYCGGEKFICKKCGGDIRRGDEVCFGDNPYHTTCLPYSEGG